MLTRGPNSILLFAAFTAQVFFTSATSSEKTTVYRDQQETVTIDDEDYDDLSPPVTSTSPRQDRVTSTSEKLSKAKEDTTENINNIGISFTSQITVPFNFRMKLLIKHFEFFINEIEFFCLLHSPSTL